MTLTRMELGFVAFALVLTLVVGFVLVPVLRKAMSEPHDEDRRGE